MDLEHRQHQRPHRRLIPLPQPGRSLFRKGMDAAGHRGSEMIRSINDRRNSTMNTTRGLNTLPAALASGLSFTSACAADLTPAEVRAIAKEAYVYGFPLVDNYRIQYGYFVDRQNPEFKAPWNRIKNIPRVYTPADTAKKAE